MSTATAQEQGHAGAPLARALRRARGRRTALALQALAVTAGGLLAAAWALRLWQGSLSVPLRYVPVDDAKFYLMLAKGLIDHGGYLKNPSLGAPFGQQLYDFPQGADNLNLALMGAFALITDNPALVVNLFYLATFALIGLSAFLVLRALDIGAGPAAAAAVLFTVLPYHFEHGASQLLLSAYYAVPLSAYLFLTLLDDRRALFTRVAGRPRGLAWLTSRTAATAVLCIVIGSDGLYYAAFAIALLLSAVVLLAVVRRPRRALAGAAVVLLIGATVVANISPSLLYEARHGENPALSRSPALDEQHAVKLVNLVLPTATDRISPLAKLGRHYDSSAEPGYCEACDDSLGVVGTVGFGWLALCALGALIGGAAWIQARRRYRHPAAGVLISLAFAIVGGLSSLTEFFLTSDIRGWNRMSIFIAFFSLLAVAQLLDAARSSRRLRRGWPVLVLAVALFGVWEETSSPFVPAYAADAREWHSDGALVSAIEQRMPRGASIFELPYIPFPEGYTSPAGTNVPDEQIALSYDSVRGYLQSRDLRWSFGAMKGRPSDWSSQLAAKPLPDALSAAAAAGFDGLWVDPRGYPGRWPRVERLLQRLTGTAPLVSPDRDLWFFDLRPYAAALGTRLGPEPMAALRQAALYPLRATCTSGGVILVNPSSRSQTATLSIDLRSSLPSDHPITVTVPGSEATQVPVGPTEVSFQRTLSVPPGASHVTLSAAAGAASGAVIVSATLLSSAYAPAVPADAPPASLSVQAGVVGPACTIP
ncbi:MAG TPA: hypothetical protein VHX88_12430 [Solirubrobacteraceae bacterium]|nr:hypothetical protein [Solirubrobacteraceae bacterium]